MTTKEPQKPRRRGCIIPGCENTGKLARGLCATHSSQYSRQRNAIPEDQREAFDAALIKKGRLLPAKSAGRPANDPNPFRELAEEMGLVAKNQLEDMDASTVDSFVEPDSSRRSTKPGPKPRKKKEG